MHLSIEWCAMKARTCHEAPDHDFHREDAAALHDGHIGVRHLQQRILHDVLRLAHPPGTRQVQDLPLHNPQTLLSVSCMLTPLSKDIPLPLHIQLAKLRGSIPWPAAGAGNQQPSQ